MSIDNWNPDDAQGKFCLATRTGGRRLPVFLPCRPIVLISWSITARDEQTVNFHIGKAVSSNLYEARQTPHAGIGLFATTNIPAGTRIFCEEALVALPDEKDITDLYRALEALPADKQAAFDSLVGHKHKHDTDFIATVRNGYKGILTSQVPSQNLLNGLGPSDSFEDVVDKHESAWEKYEANRFTVRSPGGSPDQMGIFVEV